MENTRVPPFIPLFTDSTVFPLRGPHDGMNRAWVSSRMQPWLCHYQLSDLRQWLSSEPLSAPLPGCGKDWTAQAELMGRMLRIVVSLLCSKGLSLLCFESPNLIHTVFQHFNQPPLFWVHCRPLRHWTHPEASFEPAQWKYSFPGKISIPRTGF